MSEAGREGTLSENRRSSPRKGKTRIGRAMRRGGEVIVRPSRASNTLTKVLGKGRRKRRTEWKMTEPSDMTRGGSGRRDCRYKKKKAEGETEKVAQRSRRSTGGAQRQAPGYEGLQIRKQLSEDGERWRFKN